MDKKNKMSARVNSREIFRETLLFKKLDKVPFDPGRPRESTLATWHEQGLPEGINYYEALLNILGIKERPKLRRVFCSDSFKMIPTFEEKVLEHKDGHYIVQDWMGAITEISDKYDYTYIRYAKDFVTRRWLKFPVQSYSDWEKMKKRYDPNAPGRYPQDFEEQCRLLESRDYPVGVHFNGPFWQLREWLGMENLCMSMITDPDWVEEMIDFWTDFVSKTMMPILDKVELDYVEISEDMAYKAHSMISPKMARKFLLPAYKHWIRLIKDSGCSIVVLDSDGYIGELLPIWVEAGINCCRPVEVAAGNDIIKYRETYGSSMAYMQGIDKRAIAKGGRVMEEEVMRVSSLLEEGGYIPGCDHGVPPDISWSNFIEYSRLLAELTGWI